MKINEENVKNREKWIEDMHKDTKWYLLNEEAMRYFRHVGNDKFEFIQFDVALSPEDEVTEKRYGVFRGIVKVDINNLITGRLDAFSIMRNAEIIWIKNVLPNLVVDDMITREEAIKTIEEIVK